MFNPTSKYREWFHEELKQRQAPPEDVDSHIRRAVRQGYLPIGGDAVAMLMYMVDAEGNVYDLDFSEMTPRPSRYRMESVARGILLDCAELHPELLELLGPVAAT